MKKDDYFDRIEDYLDGSMSMDERAAFENLLASDAELKIRLDDRKKFQELYVTTHRINELRGKISGAIQTEKGDTKNRAGFFSGNFRMLAAAAAIIALAVIGSVLMFNNNSGEGEEFITIAPVPADSIAGTAPTRPGEYANKDIIKGKGTFDEYFPDEFTLLYTSDTICFTWPETVPSRYLMLFDEKGKLVKKLKLKKNTREYLLMPGTLTEGTWYWKFLNDTTLIRISVTSKP